MTEIKNRKFSVSSAPSVVLDSPLHHLRFAHLLPIDHRDFIRNSHASIVIDLLCLLYFYGIGGKTGNPQENPSLVKENKMKIYNVGIIGYGGFGQFLHNAWKNIENVEVVCVSDIDKSRNTDDKLRFYEHWKDLINDPEVDIVSIAVPPKYHAEMAIFAMEAGNHVLIEKPLAIKSEDGSRILAARNRTGKVAAVNFMMRFNPLIEVLRNLTGEKVFGELRRVDVENYAQDEMLSRDHWFWKPDISGGILIEHAVHFIDLVHYLELKKPLVVTGVIYKRNADQEDRVMANILYEGGLMATHYHAFALPGFFESTSIRLLYDLAVIDLEGWIPLKGRIRALVNAETKEMIQILPNLNIRSEVKTIDIEDESRPEGWGGDMEQKSRNQVRSAGIEYHVEEMIAGIFDVGLPKGRVYSDCLAGIMKDLVKAIENPDYSPRATIEDGVLCLAIAETATHFGRKWKG